MNSFSNAQGIDRDDARSWIVSALHIVLCRAVGRSHGFELKSAGINDAATEKTTLGQTETTENGRTFSDVARVGGDPDFGSDLDAGDEVLMGQGVEKIA